MHVCVEGGGVNVRLIHHFLFLMKVYTAILVIGCIFAYSVYAVCIGNPVQILIDCQLRSVCVINVQKSPPVYMHNYTIGSHYQSLKFNLAINAIKCSSPKYRAS